MTNQKNQYSPRPLTEKEKDILISKMLERPKELTESEIKQILEDDELRDIYGISVDLKAAKKTRMELDAKDEWERFQPLMDRTEKAELEPSETPIQPNRESTYNRWIKLFTPKRITRFAAVFVGLFLVAGVIQVITNHNGEIRDNGDLIAQNNNTSVENQNPTTDLTLVVHQNEEEELSSNQSKSDISNNEDDVEIKATSNSSKPTTPVQKTKSANSKSTSNKVQLAKNSDKIDVEEYIRIQQARMDNDLAMQRAEAVINQYYTIAQADEEDYNSLITANLTYGDDYDFESELTALILP